MAKNRKNTKKPLTEVAPLFDEQERDEITIGQTTETITYTSKKPYKDRRGRFDTSQVAFIRAANIARLLLKIRMEKNWNG